ncbi:hypothetical protein VTJ83DRAFT_7457 [Remersonia thermophila]|uniref:phospholipase D n=1 Tax=Remersonia thermophila TaxID=72144 RepID=A0ABR4D5X1_9PEZI
MADVSLSDQAVRRRDTPLTPGTISSFSAMQQARVVNPASSPLGSDQYDFAVKPNPAAVENEHAENPAAPANPAKRDPSHPPHERRSPLPTLKVEAPHVPNPGTTTEPSSPTHACKSVQFSHDDTSPGPDPDHAGAHARTGSWDTRDALGKLRGSGFISKLKELAGPGGSGHPTPRASLHATTPDVPSTSSSPTAPRHAARPPRSGSGHEGSDDDADAEETADEVAAGRVRGMQRRRKRRIRRLRMDNLSLSMPATPQLNITTPDTPDGPGRLGFLRRATLGTLDDHGCSEGEGRDRLAVQRGLRRGTAWMARTGDDGDDADSPGGGGLRVGHHFRKLSTLGGGGGGVSDGDAMSPRRPFFGADRASTFGVQKWRQVKGALKMLRQKKDEQFDFSKSAELMAELFGGAPAVLMLASMIQRDEHGNKRIPVLLEQLRLRIVDSAPAPDKDSERHWIFTMELEYGSGPSQMKWTIKRTIRDILNLHWKYKLTLTSNEGFSSKVSDAAAKRPKQPRFPLSAFPYLRGARGVEDNEEEEPGNEPRADETAGELTAGEVTAHEATDVDDRPPMRRKRSRMPYLGAARRKPSALGSAADLSQGAADAAAQKRRYVERQQRMLEKYLQDMIRWLMFRPDSNRLCRFLELSALGVRLAAEGSYHGKECYLHIQSSQGLDFRRVLTPGKVIARHSRKWFLVRQSYIVCVESPENMNIYDVYLVDPKFRIVSKSQDSKARLKEKAKEQEEDVDNLDPSARPSARKHHTLKIITSERKVKLFSPNQHLIAQFEESILEMLKDTPWHRENRFGSYAPVRTGVHAQWLVDGRDYMWNVSRAISMAKDVIYIHDWWLSPELYMRRPACISQKWRLDRLLQRKAAEGVKVFVIVYRNVEAAVPIDSEYTKFSLLNLHPNIFIQRSPHQFKKNQFFFAHHEKMCIVDHDIAFLGGIDLCFGRWDTPKHPVVDDKPTGFEPQDNPKDAEHCQLFPGKDYSNPRVLDFFKLHEPYEEMYNRSLTPRMPWHDVAMQVVGQPARDLTRYFVQRWNYVRRGRKPTRPTPFLLPPPDCKPEELEAMGLSGTCEVQILRSAATWSLGIEDTEHSIQSAYIKMIETSEHFVYIENQFFITSTETLNCKIVNGIGDALVRRIIRAHQNDEDWRAVVLMPLLPGFQNEVNQPDGSSIRLILQCQFRSICRGEHSIFGRLRAAGIDPEDYIQFFSLRQWGKLNNGVLVTEQLYIHAKCIIVDDRVALIGSANINERSMLGNRDSEVAAIVRDTDLIWSTMGGKPYQVGRFAHTLRLRLMREHLGLDVDEILEEERLAEERYREEMEEIYGRVGEDEEEGEDEGPGEGSSARPTTKLSFSEPPLRSPRHQHSHSHSHGRSLGDDHRLSEEEKEHPSQRRHRLRHRRRRTASASKDGTSHDHDHDDDRRSESGSGSPEPEVQDEKHALDVEGFSPDGWKAAQVRDLDQGRDTVVVSDREVLVCDVASEGKGSLESPRPNAAHAHHPSSSSLRPASSLAGGHDGIPSVLPLDRKTSEQPGLPRPYHMSPPPAEDGTDIGGPPPPPPGTATSAATAATAVAAAAARTAREVLPLGIKLAKIDKDCMRDPLDPAFYEDVWCRAADNNTKIYRRVFRCMPDSEVTNWAEYKEFGTYYKRFKESMEEGLGLKRENEEGEGPDVAATSEAEKAGNVARPPTGDAAWDEKAALATEGEHQPQQPQQPQPPQSRAGHPADKQDCAVNSSRDTLSFAAATAAAAAGGEASSTYGRRGSTRQRSRSDSRKERRPTFSSHQDRERPPPTGVSTTSTTHNGLSSLGNGSSNGDIANAMTNNANGGGGGGGGGIKPTGSQKHTRRRRATTRGSRPRFGGNDEVLSKEEAEELLRLTQGPLVQFPYDWLVVEETNGNWLFQVDQVAPLAIYN